MRTMQTVSYNFNFKQCLKFCIKLSFEQIWLLPSILLIKIKFSQFSSQCNRNDWNHFYFCIDFRICCASYWFLQKQIPAQKKNEIPKKFYTKEFCSQKMNKIVIISEWKAPIVPHQSNKVRKREKERWQKN